MSSTPRVQHLRELLAALAPRDAAESAFRERMSALVDDAGDPFSRDRYVPGHFTASAFVVSRQRDALLLILHGKLGRWLQPGGHVDASDASILDAARREVAEETGLVGLALAHDGIFDVDVHVIPARGKAPAHAHFDVRFLFEAEAGSGTAGSDARAMRWVKLADVSALETDDSVLRAVRKLREPRARRDGA